MPARKSTLCVHAGAAADLPTSGVATPIQTSTSYLFLEEEDPVIYPRYFNISNQQVVASKIAELENGEQGLVLSSGMAAVVSVLMGLLKQGDHVLFQSGIYGGTQQFANETLPKYGIATSFLAATDGRSLKGELRENTKMIFLESPTNPLLQIVDMESVAKLAHQRGLVTVIDNTFGTPINQNPLDLGIDIVVHSGTKYLNGHSDVNCGAVVTTRERMESIIHTATQFGGTLDVRGCYLLERGLKTLALRVQRQCESAFQLATRLAEHPRVQRVYFPGLPSHPGHSVAARQMTRFGAMLSFELEADERATKDVIRRLRVAKAAISLGGVETVVCFPKDTSHAKISAAERHAIGISDSLVRVSVGIEDVDDLVADFEQALR